jgi:hypothetical protein
LLVAENGGPTLFARIVMKALTRRVERCLSDSN